MVILHRSDYFFFFNDTATTEIYTLSLHDALPISFYRMDVVDVYYVGGFGVMGWVSASEYDRSQPDPLADSMAEIIQHMNADHQDALLLLAREFARIESQEATMTAVDRLGFHVRVKTQDGTRGARIAFLREVTNPADTRKILVEMVRQARSQV